MNLGPLNRRGVLYRNIPTAGVGGAPVDALTPLRTLPLTFVDEHERTETVAARDSGVVDIQWKSRWFEGLETEMFIVFEGATYRLVKVRPLGRREGYLISGTLVS